LFTFIEIILGRAEAYKRNRSVRKEKLNKSMSSSKVEAHPVVQKITGSDQHKYMRNKEDEREVIDNFNELSVAVEAMNRELTEKNSEYKYQISKIDNIVYFSIIKQNKNNEAIIINCREITHDKYSKWISNIETEEGFFIDEAD
jgi:hypothetical protein